MLNEAEEAGREEEEKCQDETSEVQVQIMETYPAPAKKSATECAG